MFKCTRSHMIRKWCERLTQQCVRLNTLERTKYFEIAKIEYITLLSYWATMFSWLHFIFGLKHWDSNIQNLYSESTVGAKNMVHQLSNVLYMFNLYMMNHIESQLNKLVFYLNWVYKVDVIYSNFQFNHAFGHLYMNGVWFGVDMGVDTILKTRA
jgi:hypothetical protein